MEETPYKQIQMNSYKRNVNVNALWYAVVHIIWYLMHIWYVEKHLVYLPVFDKPFYNNDNDDCEVH